MKITTFAVAALSLALLAACDRGNDNRPAASGSSAAPRNEAAPSQATPSAPVTSSANNSAKSNPTPPVQGREDTRQPEQTRDFRHPDTGGK